MVKCDVILSPPLPPLQNPSYASAQNTLGRPQMAGKVWLEPRLARFPHLQEADR